MVKRFDNNEFEGNGKNSILVKIVWSFEYPKDNV